MVPGDIWGCWDWIDIHDGRDSSAKLLKSELCGNHFDEKNVIATGNSMFIRFQSDQNSDGGYFRFKTITGKNLHFYEVHTRNKYVDPLIDTELHLLCFSKLRSVL